MTDTVAIAASPRSLSVQATSWGSTMQAGRDLSLHGRCGYDEESPGCKVVGSSPGAG